jgi:hypothetical protein
MGAALVLHPAWREKPEFAAFIGESSKQFFSVNVDLGRYYTSVWDALREDWYDELVSVEYRNRRYEEVCRMWSDAVFMRELYAETDAFGEDFPFFTEDDGAFDTLVHRGRLQAEVVHGIDIPEGIPRSHFWWWLPGDPSLGDDYVVGRIRRLDRGVPAPAPSVSS